MLVRSVRLPLVPQIWIIERLDCSMLLLACVYMCASSLHLSMVSVSKSKEAPFTLMKIPPLSPNGLSVVAPVPRERRQ